jgi:dihydroxyacetone kinase-like predicted kinase
MSDPLPATISEVNPVKSINGRMLQKLIKAGLTWLRTNQQIVNTLNVFPVPDGDTGTNMVHMQALTTNQDHGDHRENGYIVAHGALMGARGNSGVILSQLWRGFARALDNLPILETKDFARALAEARDTAYKGVVRPVEGTILTVAKDIAAEAERISPVTEDFVDMLEQVVEAADRSVQNTPALLPVLKEAGVVDSGGKGLYFILDGMLRYIKGQALDISIGTVQPLSEMVFLNTLETVEPGQDYEVVVDFRPHNSLDLPVFYGSVRTDGHIHSG